MRGMLAGVADVVKNIIHTIKNMNKIIIAIAIIIVIVAGAYFLIKGSGTPAARETSQVEQNVVTYTNKGYSPSILYAKVGATIAFKNESSEAAWTASDIHPSHTRYGGTSLTDHCPDITKTAFDACAGIQPGNSWQFTFTKKGAWNYHDHLAPWNTGTIVVE